MTETTLLIDQGNTRIKWVPAGDSELDTKQFGQGGLEALAAAGDRLQGTLRRIRVSGVAGWWRGTAPRLA